MMLLQRLRFLFLGGGGEQQSVFHVITRPLAFTREIERPLRF